MVSFVLDILEDEGCCGHEQRLSRILHHTHAMGSELSC